MLFKFRFQILLLALLLPIESFAQNDALRENPALENSIQEEDLQDNYAEDDFDDDQIISDPLEGMNRGIFWFNNKVDAYVLEPIAEGYTAIFPKPVRRSVGNFFDNLSYPVHLASDLLQLKFTQAGEHTGRFLLNTTLGIGGLFDVATDMGLERHEEDIGTALGYYGIGTGPYLVLPFLGPSNVRDLVGLVGDTFLDPRTYIGIDPTANTEWEVTAYTTSGVEVIHTRADLIEAIAAAKDASIDYYSFVKNSHVQSRESLIYDGFPPEDDEWDDEEEEEEE